jgi:hypothetical protein
MIAAREVVPDDAKVVYANMRELRGARNLSDRPNAWRGRLKPFVDLDVAAII